MNTSFRSLSLYELDWLSTRWNYFEFVIAYQIIQFVSDLLVVVSFVSVMAV